MLPKTFFGYNTFITDDSFLAVGLAFLLSLIAPFLIPSFLFRIQWNALIVRWRILILGFLLSVLLGLCIYINRFVLLSFLHSADEHACYFLAECLRMGKWYVAPPEFAEFFKVVHVGMRDGKWFSVYPPGWPLLWAIGIQWHVADLLNPVFSVAAVFLLYKCAERLLGLPSALLGVALLSVSPFFLFTSASYFSHPTCLFAISGFLYSYLKWHDSNQQNVALRWAFLAGFAAGYGLLTRYLTMASVIAPFGFYHVWLLITKRRRWAMAETVFCVMLGLGLLLVLAHNFAVTGDSLMPPNQYDKEWERLGFRYDYTPITAVVYFITRLFYLMDWAPPVMIASYFFVLAMKPPSHTARLFQVSFLFIAAAYFLYFSWGGNQYGPRYYYEGFPFMVFTVAHGAVRLLSREGAIQKMVLAALIMSLGTGAYQIAKQNRHFYLVSSERKALYELAHSTLHAPSLVFIQGFLGDTLVLAEEDAVRNSPAMDAKILYAHDRGEENSKLLKFYPDRQPYRGIYDRAAKKPLLTRLS